MHMKSKLTAVALLAFAGACADLDVTNPNDADRERALSTPQDIEALVGGSFRSNFFASNSDAGPNLALALAADEYTSSAANFAGLDFYQEPRLPVNNTSTYVNAAILRNTWQLSYRAVSAAVDGLKAIEVPATAAQMDASRIARVRAFANLNIGIALGQVALLYDRGFIVDETTDLNAPVPLASYTDVMAAAIDKLYLAAEIAEANAFETEPMWMGQAPRDRSETATTFTNTELADFAYSMAARFRVQVGRTAAERAAVNWAQVITDVNRGVTEDFLPVSDDAVFFDNVKVYSNYGPFGWWDMRYAGMADSTGGYQTWSATPLLQRQPFQMASPDLRFPQSTATTGAGSRGRYVGYLASTRSQPGRGTFQWSNYRDFRYAIYQSESDIPLPWLTVREMRLLRAEALYRTNQLSAAAAIINETRTANGLPPVTDAGVPTSSGCVPRMPDGTCGSLLEALKWEKRVEVWMHYQGDWFFDSRAWGDLMVGAPLSLPVPAQDLLSLGEELYTFGGVGGRCAAGTPTNCVGGTGSSSVLIPAGTLSSRSFGGRGGMLSGAR
jgi:hypothetical protein